MNSFTDFIDSFTSIRWDNIEWSDMAEIIILAVLIYHILLWIKTTRAWTLVKGFVVIFAFLLIAVFTGMDTILWIAGNIFDIGVIALVIVFQPELRKALEQLGQKNFIADILKIDAAKEEKETFNDKTADAIVKACVEMSKAKTGALIVIENNVPLGEYERTGITMDALVSSQLLLNIFEHNTPLHDGAIIVRGNRIVSATCYLPLSDNMTLSKELGTRHRAAVGISEVSDAMTVVVSEETGAISITQYSEIKRHVSAEVLKEQLQTLQNKTTEGSVSDCGKEGKKMKLKLTDNLFLKILSVLIAILIWIVVMNINDGEKTKAFQLNVNLINTEVITENGKVFRVVDNSDVVTLKVRARKSIVDELSGSDFVLTADMLKNLKYDRQVGITVECKNRNINIDEHITLSRSNVDVSIEDSATEQFQVHVRHTGQPNSGLIPGNMIPEQTIIKISGPVSLVERIELVEAMVDITGLPGTTVKTCELKLYDSIGGPIDNTYLNYIGKNEGIDVTVNMLNTKTVPLRFSYTGAPAENYAVKEISYKPEVVEIAGNAGVLSGISRLEIPAGAVNVDGIDDELQLVVDLTQYLPSGVILKEAEDSSVLVIVEVEYVEPVEEEEPEEEEETLKPSKPSGSETTKPSGSETTKPSGSETSKPSGSETSKPSEGNSGITDGENSSTGGTTGTGSGSGSSTSKDENNEAGSGGNDKTESNG